MKATILFKLADEQYEQDTINDLIGVMKERGYWHHQGPHYLAFHKEKVHEKEKTT